MTADSNPKWVTEVNYPDHHITVKRLQYFGSVKWKERRVGKLRIKPHLLHVGVGQRLEVLGPKNYQM